MSDFTPPPPPGQGPDATAPQGFFAALFDFSFDTFVTPKIIKVVYAIFMVVIGLAYLVLVASAFSQSSGTGLLVLIGGALGVLLYTVLFRMTLEFFVATFKIAENTGRMAAAMERDRP